MSDEHTSETMNYQYVGSGIDVIPILLELNRNPHIWNQGMKPWRSERGPHSQADSVWLRFNDEKKFIEKQDYTGFNDEHHPIWYQEAKCLPSIRKPIFDLMRYVNGESLGGVVIYRLKPGSEISPHEDHSWHVDYHDKFNICLQSNPKAEFYYENEAFSQNPGEIHWFRNDVKHGVRNNGNTDHIVMCVCIHIEGDLCQQHG